ncbi:MAG: class I SAM-dependent methyltransferase [Actinomycetota bacterium]|nr:class I SAM-dependent methyltransferase [Actinomycetota bacterium]
MDSGSYTGVDNLEVMEVAVNYAQYLADLVAGVAGPPGPARLLDFGAGTATHALALRECGYEVACVEADDHLRERARALGFRAWPRLADLNGEQFPTVYTLNVLEHIEDDVDALRALYRVTVPGGSLVVYVPAFPVLYTAMDRKVGHVRRYRKKQLMERVAEAGFRVRSCRYADSLGFFATVAYRLAGNRRGDISTRSVAAYDRFFFPASRRFDLLAGRWFGKNLVLVADRPGGPG